MKKWNKRIVSVFVVLVVIIAQFGHASNQLLAASFKINLKKHQLFYILPGNEFVDYNVKITSGNQLGNHMICTSSDTSKATISDDGKLHIIDAGTFKISVQAANGETIARTVQSLLRTDWTRVVNITNSQKITVASNRVATYKIKNLMDFPLKMQMYYTTYDTNMNLIQSEKPHDTIYIAANEAITYKEIMPENVKYIAVNHVTFAYDQYGLDKISTKKVNIKENISTSKKSKTTKIIKETVTNTNSKNILVPYQTYVYDKDGKITSISYNTLRVLSKQKNVFNGKYYTKQPTGQSEYASKIMYKFFAPLPEF